MRAGFIVFGLFFVCCHPSLGATKDQCPSLEFTNFFERFLTSAVVQRRFTNFPLRHRHVDSSKLDTEDQFESKTVDSFEHVPITFGSEAAKRIVPNRVEMNKERIHFQIEYGADRRSRQRLAKVTFNREESDSFSVVYAFFRNKSCWLLRTIDDDSL
jgi:hypothetical protein